MSWLLISSERSDMRSASLATAIDGMLVLKETIRGWTMKSMDVDYFAKGKRSM